MTPVQEKVLRKFYSTLVDSAAIVRYTVVKFALHPP